MSPNLFFVVIKVDHLNLALFAEFLLAFAVVSWNLAALFAVVGLWYLVVAFVVMTDLCFGFVQKLFDYLFVVDL